MKTLILSLVFGFLVIGNSFSQEKYASSETKEVIEKMIKAHGGYDQWKSLKTLSFTNSMYSESLGFVRFWVSDQTVDMQTRRSYQYWPLFGSEMTYDGNEVWTKNWQSGNPPNHQHSVYYYYVNLPWLTQDKNVVLGEVSKLKHPAFKNEVFKIKMSFTKSPTLGKSAKDTFTLYIDKETYILSGYEYTVSYGPLLDVLNVPETQESFGPMLRINTYTGDINGLKFPMLMTTKSLDLKQQYGDHAIYDYKINGTFDEQKMIKPENAVVDTSVDKRKSSN
ncbi:hypothetical protein [uncultured Psychroserpens sp.]|uniref:hypothetical protein n=1 Tax=uncultured Psychroserpens sp. TaxID=255436 RepID=UPI00261E88A2|nr:hypothetical protein [uncultured Psychroserpens sp.]